MINSIKAKIYKMFHSKMFFIFLIIIILLASISFANLIYKANKDEETILLEVILTYGFICVDTLLFPLAFLLNIGEFTFKGYDKGRIGFVQDWLSENVSDIIAGFVLFLTYALTAIVLGLIAALAVLGPDKVDCSNMTYCLQVCGTYFVLYMTFITMLTAIKNVVKKQTPALITILAYVVAVPIVISTLSNYFQSREIEINIARYEVVSAIQNVLLDDSKWHAMGIPCICASGYFVVSLLVIFLTRKRDRV